MSSAVECRQFCLTANEIRYQYAYHRQKLGIYMYIYIYIRLSVYIKQGGGAVTMTTPRHHRLSQRHGATSDHKVVTPTALPRSVQYIGATLITVRQYIYGMNMSALAHD